MNDIMSTLAQLSRPKMLVRAARLGVSEYSRDRDLKRLLKIQKSPSARKAVFLLMDLESELEAARVSGSAHYNVSRHVEIMIAIMGEARLAQAGLRHSEADADPTPALSVVPARSA